MNKNKPISLVIKEVQDELVKLINGSNLPASVLEQIFGRIYQQIAQAAQAELAQAEKEYKESGEA